MPESYDKLVFQQDDVEADRIIDAIVALVERLEVDPGENYRGECKLFKARFGARFPAVCRGLCNPTEPNKKCQLVTEYNSETRHLEVWCRCVPREEHPVAAMPVQQPTPTPIATSPTSADSTGPFCVYGPSAAVVAWIPYYKGIGDLPANAYTRHKFSGVPFDRLFDSGNQSPPLGFSGQADLEKFISLEDFRAVLSLRDVELHCDEHGKAQFVFYRPFSQVGYTPMRAGQGDRKLTFWHSRGEANTCHNVDCRDNYATIRWWIKFKVGKVVNGIAFLMTSQWAPFAWARIDYTIRSDRSVTIEFSGSYMPTRYDYVHWNRVGVHDMLANTSEQIDGFLNGGDCQPAPGTPTLTWTGQAVCRK